MSFTYRPAIREKTPCIIGLAGPSKSGKTYSALRLAVGIAQGGQIAMINTEGPRGHQYAEKFQYIAADMLEPFSMKRYEEAIKDAAALKPAVLIIDSVSHAHEGTGGMLDYHESELNRLAGEDYKKRERMTYAAWVKPKADEASMINTMLQVGCHIILCFRAKEKIKIVSGKAPIDLGWRPIGSDRIHFETAFTLILPPNSKGTPDLSATGSELREPFDKMIKAEQINEELGARLREWAVGTKSAEPSSAPPSRPPAPDDKKEKDFVNIMARERKRLGDERFLGVLGGSGFEKVDEIVKREDQIKIYKILVDLTATTPVQEETHPGPKIESGKTVDDYILGENMVTCPPGGERAGQTTNIKGYCNSICKHRKHCFLFVDKK